MKSLKNIYVILNLLLLVKDSKEFPETSEKALFFLNKFTK